MPEQNKPQEQSLEGLAPYPQQVQSSDPGQFSANSTEGQPFPTEGGSPEMPNPNQDLVFSNPFLTLLKNRCLSRIIGEIPLFKKQRLRDLIQLVRTLPDQSKLQTSLASQVQSQRKIVRAS